MQSQVVITALLIIFIMYRMFLRIRRNIGWQQLLPRKMGVSIVLFSIIGLLFLMEGTFRASTVISDLLGILVGSILAYVGAQLTQIELRNGHWFYRPNLWIGSLVTVIFIGRFIYRLFGIFTAGPSGALQSSNPWENPVFSSGSGWTAGLMLIMFAYYVTYNVMMLRKQRFASSRA
ncbi:hypothetical protein [Paenibacillus sp. OAS669]|uniref:hypothetical protein n=1 Tax=Paenibacillus sp. OAS669 TaxID=2663821 RepID=UPI00178A889E|nr:hypothetical protein [Paenibacillus sp. OAS669]MBE1442910.1 hypothetical protein [Paenibacillus sp. OAS669]